jgi:hypothetical protein
MGIIRSPSGFGYQPIVRITRWFPRGIYLPAYHHGNAANLVEKHVTAELA